MAGSSSHDTKRGGLVGNFKSAVQIGSRSRCITIGPCTGLNRSPFGSVEFNPQEHGGRAFHSGMVCPEQNALTFAVCGEKLAPRFFWAGPLSFGGRRRWGCATAATSYTGPRLHRFLPLCLVGFLLISTSTNSLGANVVVSPSMGTNVTHFIASGSGLDA